MSFETLHDREIDLFIDYGLKWTEISLSTKEIDFQKAVSCLQKAYKYAGLKPPKIFMGPFDNPIECAKAQAVVKRLPDNTDLLEIDIKELIKQHSYTNEELSLCLDEQLYGSLDGSWLGVFDYSNKIAFNALPEIDGLIKLAKECFWWAPYDKIAFVQNRPLEIHLNDEGQLHNDNGPAIKWRGEDRTYDIYVNQNKGIN
jgi:hypothetical protein